MNEEEVKSKAANFCLDMEAKAKHAINVRMPQKIVEIDQLYQVMGKGRNNAINR